MSLRSFRLGHIVLCDGDISVKPMDFCPSNRTLLKHSKESLFIESRKFIQTRREGDRRRLEDGLVGRFGAQIERAHVEAIIAPEYLVPHAVLEVRGNHVVSSAQLNGEIGDTASGVDDVGLDDCACRAGLNAEGTASAQIRSRFVRREFQCGQNFSQ